MRHVRRLVALAVLLALLVPGVALPCGVTEVAREVRCPTCNTPLDVSSSPVALDMKRYIGERCQRGWSKERVIDGLVAEFGRGVLATPPKSGFDLVAWLVPLIAVGAGLAALPFLTRAWTRRRRLAGDVPTLTEEDSRAIDQELKRLGPL